jgi:crotonobetaine/carnitine-CoA ligase
MAIKPMLRKPIEVLSLFPAHDGTLHGILDSRARLDPARRFTLFENRTLSYAEFQNAVSRAARMLVEKGLGKSDRLAVMAPNSDAYLILFFAAARIGAILVPVNPDFGVEEAGYILRHAGVSAVACTSDNVSVALAAGAGMAEAPWFMLLQGASDSVPGFDELLKSTTRVSLPEDVSGEDVCLILYTSGTTGFPKGVMHTQRNLILAGEAFVERMVLQPEDRLLVVLPLFHINALFYSLGGALAAGASLVLVPKFSASAFWHTAADSGATEVNILATVGNILVRRPRSEFVPHRIVKVYGAPISREIAEVFRAEFNIPVLIEGYGMTEIPGACNNPFEGPQKTGSMGQPARHPDHRRTFAEMRVVDSAGNDVPDGQAGEIAVRTPIVMKGYYRDPEQTAAAFRDGWFLTGDLGYRDQEGYFYFVARSKEIIRKRGENISAAELDRVIGSHPEVVEAAAIPVPSDLGEDEILVAVIPKPGAKLAAEQVAEWCARHLAPIKRPRYVVFVDSLPHTPTHRVARFKLRQDPTLLAKAVDLQAGN